MTICDVQTSKHKDIPYIIYNIAIVVSFGDESSQPLTENVKKKKIIAQNSGSHFILASFDIRE